MPVLDTVSPTAPAPTTAVNVRPSRGQQLAARLEAGAQALMAFASDLSDSDWQRPIPGDGRTIGVVVDHVASVYPIEVDLARTIIDGQPVVGVSMAGIHAMNAAHAKEHATVTKAEAIGRLATNAAAAANVIRAWTDDQLAAAAPVSLYANAPLTAQFVLEDHAVRHSYHHLARIRAAVAR